MSIFDLDKIAMTMGRLLLVMPELEAIGNDSDAIYNNKARLFHLKWKKLMCFYK